MRLNLSEAEGGLKRGFAQREGQKRKVGERERASERHVSLTVGSQPRQ